VVVLVVGEVDGAAADLDAHFQGGLVDAVAVVALAAEGRDQRWVNVHHPVLEVGRDRQQLQEAGQTDQVGLHLADGVKQRPAELLPRSTLLAIDHARWDARLAGPLQAMGLCAVGQHDDHLGGDAARPDPSQLIASLPPAPVLEGKADRGRTAYKVACTACHVGAFGPLLTPFGRAFKIGAYTQTGGTG